MGKKLKESPIVSFRVSLDVVEKLVADGRLKHDYTKSELSNLIRKDWLASVGAGIESTLSVNSIYDKLAKIDRILEILEDNQPIHVVDTDVPSVDEINEVEKATSTEEDNKPVPIDKTDVLSVDETNEVENVTPTEQNNKLVPVAEDNSIESLNLKKNTYTALKQAQINTLDDLNNYGVTGLRSLKNLGDKSISQIVEALRRRGIELPSGEEARG